jgi:hypothetical protein
VTNEALLFRLVSTCSRGLPGLGSAVRVGSSGLIAPAKRPGSNVRDWRCSRAANATHDALPFQRRRSSELDQICSSTAPTSDRYV